MADDFKIGAGLALDGEADFKRAITGINKDLTVLGSEMKKVTAQFDGNAGSMEALTAKQKVYNDRADEQRKKIEVMTAALENAKKEFGENSDKVKDWQIKLNNAEADLSKTESAIKQTTSQIDNFGKEADDSGEEIEKAGKQAKNSGDDAEKGESGWSKLGSGLAKAGEFAAKAVAAFGAAAVAAGTALAATSVSGAAYADDVMTLSAQTGIATDKLQEYKYAAELVDVSTETLTKSMAKNIKSMKGVQDGTKLSVDAYERLGVSVLNSDGSMRDGQAVYWETIDALGKMDNETERDALAMQILGKSAQELNPLIEAGSARMQELAAKAQEAGYILSTDTLEAFGKFDDQLQFLKVGSEAAKNALGTVLLPVLTELATDGTSLLGDFTNGILDANGDIGKIGETIGSTLSSLVNKIIERLPEIVEAGMGIIGALGQGLMDNLPVIIDAAVQVITMLATGLIEALPQLVDAALLIIVSLAMGIADALPELIPTIVDTVLLIVETLIENVGLLVDASIAIIVALATGLIDALPKLIEKIPEIIIKLVEAIVNNLPKIIEAGIKIIIALAGALIKAIPQLIKAIPQILKAIGDGLLSFVTKMGEIGLNLITGLWNGIKDAGAWLWGKISGFFGGIVDRIKDFFGIKSPSKLFANLGEFMAQGLGEGFGDEMKSVTKDMNKAVPTSFDVAALTGKPSISASGISGGYGTAVSNIYMDSVLIASASGRAQFRKNSVRARSYGVVPV